MTDLPRAPRARRLPAPVEGRRQAPPAVEGRATPRPTASPSASAGESIDVIVSSPYLRCVGTVAPLAAKLGARGSRRPTRSPRARRLSQALRLFEKVQDHDVGALHARRRDAGPARPLRTARREAPRPPDGEGFRLGVRDRRRQGTSCPVRAAAQPPELHPSFTCWSPRRTVDAPRTPQVPWAACGSS